MALALALALGLGLGWGDRLAPRAQLNPLAILDIRKVMTTVCRARVHHHARQLELIVGVGFLAAVAVSFAFSAVPAAQARP